MLILFIFFLPFETRGHMLIFYFPVLRDKRAHVNIIFFLLSFGTRGLVLILFIFFLVLWY